MFNTRLRKRRRDQIQGNAEFDYEEWLRKPKKVKSDDIVDMNMGYPQRYYIGHHHASVDFPISSERRSFSSSSSDEETPEKHVTSQSSTFSSSSTLTNSPSSRKYQKNESSHSSKTSHRSPSGSSVPSSPIQQNSNRFRRRELRRSSSLHDLYSNIYIDEDHMVNEDEYHGEVILGKSVYPLSSRLRNHAKPTNLSRVKGRPFHPDLEILSQATNTPSKSNDAFRQYTISSASSGTHSTLITPQQSLSRNAFQDVIMPENHDDMFSLDKSDNLEIVTLGNPQEICSQSHQEPPTTNMLETYKPPFTLTSDPSSNSSRFFGFGNLYRETDQITDMDMEMSAD